MSCRRIFIAAVLVALAGAAGCARPDSALPAVEWGEDVGVARQILIERARSVRTVSATGLLTLTRPDGQSVRFDAALVTAPPDRLRLRAWKLGRAILDLTLTPDGLWLLSPQDRSLRDKVESAGAGAGQIARQWALLSGAFFEREDLVVSLEPRSLVLAGNEGELALRCYVDRRTLVPRLYTLRDDRGRTRFRLRLDDYQMIGDIPYPHRVQAESDSGKIVVQLLDVELNTELAPGAFTPPRRAEKVAEQDAAKP
jgi:hypothetical protein